MENDENGENFTGFTSEPDIPTGDERVSLRDAKDGDIFWDETTGGVYRLKNGDWGEPIAHCMTEELLNEFVKEVLANE